MPRDLEMLPVRHLRSLPIPLVLILPFLSLSLSGCKTQDSSTQESTVIDQAPPGSLELVFPRLSGTEYRMLHSWYQQVFQIELF